MEKVTCRNCKKEGERENFYKAGEKSYYCNEQCYNEKIENKTKKKYKPPTEKPSETENPCRLYTDYIQSIYLENGYDKKEISWELIMSQTKNMIKEHENWKYEGMQYVLWYMYEIIELNLFALESNGSIISLIPFYYQEAQNFYNKVQEIEELVDKFEFQDNVVVIKNSIKKNKNRYKEINMEEIL